MLLCFNLKIHYSLLITMCFRDNPTNTFEIHYSLLITMCFHVNPINTSEMHRLALIPAKHQRDQGSTALVSHHSSVLPSRRAGILQETLDLLFPLLVPAELLAQLLQYCFPRFLQRRHTLFGVISQLLLSFILMYIALNTLYIWIEYCGLQVLDHRL